MRVVGVGLSVLLLGAALLGPAFDPPPLGTAPEDAPNMIILVVAALVMGVASLVAWVTVLAGWDRVGLGAGLLAIAAGIGGVAAIGLEPLTWRPAAAALTGLAISPLLALGGLWSRLPPQDRTPDPS